ncbi:MAG TPA: hypothetical protein VN931_11600 [Fibrobacteria bacterium]|nr:hypothetical protein [Fibrobacteria bacterium]
MNKFHRSLAIALAAGFAATATAATPDTVEIHDHDVTGTTNWTNNHIYRMHFKVFVRSGTVLNIQPGTVVLADSRQDSATVLVVERGGKIYAQGTATQPIIFTSELDNMVSTALPNNNGSRGLWGGIYIFGRAPNNEPGGVSDYTSDITGDTADLRYGDSTNANPHDNSGALSYVSIRYTGIADLSTLAGLMLASVGDSTRIDHIEVYTSGDDAIDLEGGTVNLKYIETSFSAGDAFYYSEGYRGDIQYLFCIQNVIPGGASNGVNTKIETEDTLQHPTSIGRIWNATFISTGDSTGKSLLNTYTGKYKYALVYKKDGSGTFANSVVTECPYGGVFVDTSTLADAEHSKTSDSLGHTLVIENNLWDRIGAGDSLPGVANGLPYLATYLAANHNDVANPMLGGISWTANKGLDPRPSSTGPAYQDVGTVPADGILEQTTFRGAFGQDNWAAGWTALSTGSFFSDASNTTGILRKAGSTGALAILRGRTLSLQLPTAANVQIDFLDVSGRVAASRTVALGAGDQQVIVPSEVRGLSVVRVRAGNAAQSFLATLP